MEVFLCAGDPLASVCKANETPKLDLPVSIFSYRRLLAVLAVWVCVSGCAQLRLPAIDPTGQSIFLPQTSTPLVGPFAGTQAVFPSAPSLPAPGTFNPIQPYGWAPPVAATYPQQQGLLGGLLSGGRFNPLTSAVGGPPAAPPQPLMVIPEYGGAAPVPAPIASNGLFGSRSFLPGSGSPRPGYNGTFTITPSRMVAPVGSTVILRAGICDEAGYLVMRQPIEWSLSPDSVGSIVDVDKTAKRLWRHMFHKPPEKESGHYAVGLTSTVPQLLDRGNVDPNDDIWLMRGQTWMSVTSGSEGATHVTSVAPSVNGWEERKENATIYWVDGQWRLPSPAVSGYGGHTLVTNVARCSTGQPISNWIVRYQILGGTPAALDSSGAQILEVPTDSQGNASVAVIPRDGGQGVTTIGVQVIRPGFAPGESPVKIGDGSTSITWTDQSGPGPSLPSGGGDGGFSDPGPLPDRPLPPLEPQQPPQNVTPSISLDVRGPVVAEVGREVEYQLLVTNTGGVAIETVEIDNEIPAGLRYLQSNPQGGEFGDRVRWDLGRLEPGQTGEVRVLYRGERAGVVQNCARAIGDGAQSEDCATTDLQGQSLSITLEGPATANVGDRVEYDVVLRNESNQPVNNLNLRAEFDAGLEHPFGTMLEWPIARLEANETQRKPLNFTARQAGRQCVEVTVTSSSGGTASDQTCVDVGGTGAGGGTTLPPIDNTPPLGPGTFPGPATPGPTLPPSVPSVRIRKTGPDRARVGDVVEFFITIQTGNLAVTNIRLIDEFDLGLEAVQAMPGPSGEPFQRDGNRLIWEIPYLPPNKMETFQINCRCVAPSARVCNRAFVINDNGLSERDETCLEVVEDRQFGSATDGPAPLPGARPPLGSQPTLGLDVRRSGPSLQGNGLLEYIVEVTNRASQDDHNVALSIETPEGTRYFNSYNPPQIEAFRTTPDGRQVDFLPISTLRPGETMPFRVLVRQEAATIGNFKVQAKSDLNPNTVVRDDQS
jgi:uncharacterized repeat protein (TIGR01451 family)